MDYPRRYAVPSVRIQWSQAEVALLILATPEEQAQEVETKLAIAQRAWKWKSALRKPQRLLDMLRSLCLQQQQRLCRRAGPRGCAAETSASCCSLALAGARSAACARGAALRRCADAAL